MLLLIGKSIRFRKVSVVDDYIEYKHYTRGEEITAAMRALSYHHGATLTRGGMAAQDTIH